MKETYQKAINFVFEYEGGYTNDPKDPGGPTNWGITLADASKYWRANVTANDVKNMPKTVAEDLYARYYADPIEYNSLPAGVDFSVLDYAVNSGVQHSIKTLQGIIGVEQDGVMGQTTLKALDASTKVNVINQIWDERLAYNKSLHTWSFFGRGWAKRIKAGKALALSMASTNTVAKPRLLSNLFNFMKRKST